MISRSLYVLLFLLNCSAFGATSKQPDSDVGEMLKAAQAFARDNIDPDILSALQSLDRKTVSEFFIYQEATTNEIAVLRAKLKENELRLKADEYAAAAASDIANLKAWKRYYEAELAEKLKDFSDIKKKISLLQLSPSQLSSVEEYNRSLRQHITFWEWITENVTWFEVSKDLVILVFGMCIEGAWERFKHFFSHSSNEKLPPSNSSP